MIVPGDKSISHRALLLNALADGPSRVENLLWSEDVAATAGALRAMGVDIALDGTSARVSPPPDGLQEPGDVLDCGNSGTSMRLLAGILAARPFHAVLTGDASLRRRPMGRVIRPLREMGATVDGRGDGSLAPFAIRGGELQPGWHTLEVASAQVKSAILLAGLRSGVSVAEPRKSRDHTERMLARMGARFRITTHGGLILEPCARLAPVDVDVPGDISAAAFFLVLGAILPGSDLTLPGVGINPSRAGVIDALRAMGADITVAPIAGKGEPRADLRVRSSRLVGARIDGELALRCLDELPVLAIAAAFAEGLTVIADASELRVKESDRIARTVAGLQTLGVACEEQPDGMLIHGGRPTGPGAADASGDHRIAMAFAVAGLATPGGVHITGADAISSSFPDFFDRLEALL